MFYGPAVFDKTYFLILIGMGLSMLASNYVTRTFQRYSSFTNQRGLTGTEVAQQILRLTNVQGVGVQAIAGNLTDNYNSQTKLLSLSEATANSASVAAIGVAAHECGHAVQDAVNYVPLKLRAAIVPLANFGAGISMPLILLGLFMGQFFLTAGIICFSFAFVFQVVTLPVEFNASRRALAILAENQLLTDEELAMVRKVLVAAALTYVASAISVFLQLLRLIMLFGNRRD